MVLEYSSNIKIAGYTLPVNPDTYSKTSKFMGSFNRTVAGSLTSQQVSERKYIFKISALTQSAFLEIQKRVAADHNIELIDYVPIAERGSQSRTSLEDLSTDTINGETILTYIPIYTVSVINWVPKFTGNTVEYTIELEEQ